jgi:tetratricopeptide (TPR) repeat protein
LIIIINSEHQKAIENYDQAIALDPKDDNAFGNRGTAYTYLGGLLRALSFFGSRAIV